MSIKQSTVLSCIQPTAEMHIGNYFGAIENWVHLQKDYSCIYGIVDLHAMTMPYEPSHLREYTNRMAIDLLACGIDPEETILFIQSLVPEHSALCWILSCYCSFGELGRMAQFKEKSEQLEAGKRGQFVSAGLFTYPVLQAADILIYRAKYVPVGKDQEQHLELSHKIARRFNNVVNQPFFPECEPLFTETPKIMSLADPNQKMSKNLGAKHYIGLFEEEQSIREKIGAAVTDTGALPPGVEMSPGVANLFEILRACGKKDEEALLLEDYRTGNLKYVHLKQVVSDAVVELTGTLRAKREEIFSNAEDVELRVREMSEKARIIAAETLSEVHDLIGLPQRDQGKIEV